VILQRHWNGAKRLNTQTLREWAKSMTMTWKRIHPLWNGITNSTKIGISLSKEAMQVVGARLERHPELPKPDILIRPTCVV